MGYYVPWKSITAVWKSATQLWSQAWYEETPVPPTPGDDGDKYISGALDPRQQTAWANWIENQKRRKYKRKIELLCVVGGVEFKQEKDNAEETIIGFKVNSVSLNTSKNQISEVKLNNVEVTVKA